MSISYKGVLGNGYADYLRADQFDAFSVKLVAGTIYNLNIVSEDVPLDIALAGPQGLINTNVSLPVGQVFSYTATVTGQYGIGLGTATGVSGSYTIVTNHPANNAVVTETDTTLGLTTTKSMTPYTGPVVGLADQFIDVSPDNLNITSTTPNVFLHSGSGEDAVAVTSGNNVLDGSTGSNFLVGGTGHDTFFVDDRVATKDIWSTMVNFHTGDSATIWGVSQADFQITTADNQGAAGYQGLTIKASAAGRPNASLTLVNYTRADLSNGRLSVTYGFDAPSNSHYSIIHAN